MADQKKLYALLIGIDKYAQPRMNLAGCVSDVQRWEEFLKKNYVHLELHIKMLLNEEATRQNVIDTFRSHLKQAGENDIAFFHYSGHGSTEKAPPEFQEFFPSGKNQTLVCYDSRNADNYDLADKELALLIQEVAEKKPHIVINLDSCHSGEATRETGDDTGDQVRQEAARDGEPPRPLEHYLEGQYAQMETLKVPMNQHILLAACRDDQLAWETRTEDGGRSGLYTNTLMNMLSKVDHELFNLSYANIFTKARIFIRNSPRDQEPQIEAFLGFDSNSSFLDGKSIQNNKKLYPVHWDKKEKKWRIDYGAIQGLNPDEPQDLKLFIYSNTSRDTESSSVIAEAKGDKVLGQTCLLKDSPALAELDKEALYNAEIVSLRSLPKQVRDNYSIQKEDGDQEYKVYQHFGKDKQKLVFASPDLDQVDRAMNDISRWENIKVLHNEASSLKDDDFQLNFYSLDVEADQAMEGESLAFEIHPKGEAAWASVKCKVEAENNSDQDLHFALIYLSSMYGIYVANEKKIPPGSKTWMNPKDETVSELIFTQAQNELGYQESNITLKLIVSTVEIDGFLIEQNEIYPYGTRFASVHDEPVQIKEEWQAKTLHIHLKKKEPNIGASQNSSVGYQAHFFGSDLVVPVPGLAQKYWSSMAKLNDSEAYLLHYPNYSILQNAERQLPFYSATNIDGATFHKIARKDVFKGSDKWAKDPRISEEHQLGYELYKAEKSDFDRGHMTKREYVQWGQATEEAKEAARGTFFYTNAAPQRKEVNQSVWRSIEDYILHNQAVEKTLKVNLFTGPVLKEDDPYFVTKVKDKEIQLPTLFWKVIYFTKSDRQLYRVAFLVGQKHLLKEHGIVDESRSTEDSEEDKLFMDYKKAETYQVNVQLIEELTGLSFHPAEDPFQDDKPNEVVLTKVEVRGIEQFELKGLKL